MRVGAQCSASCDRHGGLASLRDGEVVPIMNERVESISLELEPRARGSGGDGGICEWRSAMGEERKVGLNLG